MKSCGVLKNKDMRFKDRWFYREFRVYKYCKAEHAGSKLMLAVITVKNVIF